MNSGHVAMIAISLWIIMVASVMIVFKLGRIADALEKANARMLD